MELIKPVIVIGMHRSGTSLVSSLLQKMGVFMGHYRDKNEESWFFLKANHWIMNQFAATWDYPTNYNLVGDNEDEMVLRVLKKQMSGFYARFKYFGPALFLSSNFQTYSKCWGWKDPRNTFTLPLWLKMFPEAKVIAIQRNPLDTCSSMVKRERLKHQKLLNSNFEGDAKSYIYKGSFFNTSLRLQEYKSCFDLWKEYNQKTMSHVSEGRVDCTIKYESLLENPLPFLKELNTLLQLDKDEAQLCSLEASIDKSRAYAYSFKNEEVRAFYQSIQNDALVAELGYSDLQ